MKVDFSQTLKDLEGKEIKEPSRTGGELKPVTLKDICANALMNSTEGNGDDKLKKYDLALKIAGASKPIDLVSEDIVLIKGCITKYPPLYYGQTVHMLEGDNKK